MTGADALASVRSSSRTPAWWPSMRLHHPAAGCTQKITCHPEDARAGVLRSHRWSRVLDAGVDGGSGAVYVLLRK
jgi:hypothetical protein